MAFLGNTFSLALFFGVDFLFGSIAALLALFWLGPRAGLLVAVVGGSATWLLLGHPYAALVLVAEIAFVGGLRQRAVRREQRIPMLATSDALYWVLLGIPLSLFFDQVTLGLDATSAWVFALKQAINGLLNTAVAGLIVLTAALFLKSQRGVMSFRRVLFNVLLLALLLPALLLTMWQNLGLKHRLETEFAQRAKLTGAVVVNQLAQRVDVETTDPLELEAALDALSQSLCRQLSVDWGLGLSLTFEPWSTWAPDAEEGRRATSVEGLLVTLPESSYTSLIALWRDADYSVRLPKDLSPLAHQALIVSFSAAPLIDALQQQILRLLLALLSLALFGITLAAWLSSRLAQPLQQLVQATQQLPPAIAGLQPLPPLTQTAIRETDELAATVTDMAQSLRASFDLLESEKQRQSQQQAIATLQATLLSRLIERDEDEPAFADDLCGELERLLPTHTCLLLRQGPSGELKPLGRACVAALAPDNGTPSLLAQAAVIACCKDALKTATPYPLPAAASLADTDAAAASGLVLPIVGHASLLIAIEHQATEPDTADARFARKVLEVAISLAGVAFEALQLRRLHQVLIEALSQAQTGVLITERIQDDDLITYVNSGFEAMTGYSAAEVIGRNCRFLQGEDRAQAERWQMREAIRAGDVCSVIMRNYRKDGSLFWNSLHLSPMRDRAGQVTHYIGVQQDVSEAIQTLERMRLSEARLQEAQAMAHVGSWAFDINSGQAQWSDETFRLFGFVPGEVDASLEAFLKIIDLKHCLRLSRAYAAAKKHPQGACRTELDVCGPDGIRRTLLQQGRLHFDAEGAPERLVGTCLDVTELRRTEASLRQQEERYRLMVENVEDLIVRVDPQGRFEFVSPSYCETFGRTEQELLGNTFMPSVHPDNRTAVADAMQSLYAPPYHCSLEQRERTVRGWRWLQWSNTAVRDDRGEVIGIIGVGRDITERKQAEVELAKREAMVSELLALATGFVSVSDDASSTSTEQALARVGDFIGADRSYLFYLSADGGKVETILERTAENVASIRAHYLNLPATELPMMMAPLAVGEPVVIADVAEFGASRWVRERHRIETQQVRALLLAPLQIDEHLFGFVGVEMVHTARAWSTVEAQFLQLFANILVASEQRTRSLAALRQSNARYDALARQNRTITWELDAEGRFHYISEVCEAVLGYAPAEMLGRHYSDYIAEPEAGEQATKAADLMARRQPLDDLIIPFRSRAGTPLWLSSDGRPILAEDGHCLGYRGTTKDVTERQLALQRLARSEARLSAIFDNTPIGIALIGQDRRPLLVNQALAQFLGRKAEILTQMRLNDITHPNDLHGTLGALDEVLKGQRGAYRTTSRYLHADGQVLWGDLRVSLLPSSTADGSIALAMIENVTDLHEARERQRAAEQELTDYAEQLESLLDLVNLSMPYTEQIQALLRLARRSLRLDSAAVWRLGADASYQLLSAVPDDHDPPQAPPPPALTDEAFAERGNPVIIASSAEAAASPEAHSAMIGVVIDGTTPGGDQEPLLLTLEHATAIPPLELGQRQLLRLIAQRIAAVRHRHQLQENLIQSRERETIGHLASGVSHDFNNLLGVIDANLFFIADGLDEQAVADPEIGQVIAETRSALGQAKIITSGMLTISGSGKIPLESIDLASTIGELEQILAQVLPPRIELRIDIAAGLQAYSNRAFLQSALLNLALNARDAMSEQGTLTIAAQPVHVETETQTDSQPRVGSMPAADCVEVCVTDTGNGIPPELLERIFEPQFSTKTKHRGHGLGLFMVREFVARTQAGLWVDSDSAQGSRFRLLLPARATPKVLLPPASLPASPPSPPEAQPGQTARSPAAIDAAQREQAPRRILLVEDDRRVRDALSRLLKVEGFALETASHGEAALQRLAALEGGIDLVLSDIAMPVMDGLDLFARLSEQYPTLPVILMTGQQAHWEPPLNSRGEPVPILRKPIDLGTLKDSMRQMLAPTQGANEAS